MEKRSFRILGLLLMLTTISESGVIKEDISGDGEIPLAINKFDKKLGLHPGIGSSEEEGDGFGIYEFDMGANDPQVPPDYDYGKPEEGSSIPGPDKGEPGIIKPEKIPPVDEDDDLDKKSEEEDVYEPFDGEEDIDKSVGEDKDSKADKDEGIDESHHDKDDEDKKVPEEEDEDVKTMLDEDEDKKISEEDEEKIPEGDEDIAEHVPDVHDDDHEKPDEDDENIGGGEEAGFFHGGFFNTPFFNLERVHKYFNQLERALGHVFKQTLDEAMLLNGTYANTTEEEVVIDGKTYIVKKSLIKGADNHSSIYVEALSSKPKTEEIEEIKEVDATNVTHT